MIYLDYAASTPIDPRVVAVITDIYENHPGNPSSRTHKYGEDCRVIVENARSQVSALMQAYPYEVIFTSGATEANNLAIRGLFDFGSKNDKRHIITSSIEHKSVLNALGYLERAGFEVSYLQPSENGTIGIEQLERAIREDTLLVSIMHANNETGIIQPVEEICDLIDSLPDQKKPYLHVDAAQTAGKICKELQKLRCDMISVSSHKMYGPQGIGALIVKQNDFQGAPIEAILFGGDQEQGLRPGTIPTALIGGFGEAARLALELQERDLECAKAVERTLLQGLSEAGINYAINGSAERMPFTINVMFTGVSSEALMIAGRNEFAISNGSACTSNSYKPSYVLTAMGLTPEEATNSVRISWGRGIDETQMQDFLNTLIPIVKSLQ